MTRKPQAPNRVFSFEDLRRPGYRAVLRRLHELLRREDVSYLHPSKTWEYPWALENARLAPGSRVLDAGCGASIFPIYLASAGYPATAVDVWLPGRIDRLHGLFIKYIRGDLALLPLADSSFDAIFCISVIEHLEENCALMALREMRRVLRPGGRLLLTTDYYLDSEAEIWYETPGLRFRVDWRVSDEEKIRDLLAKAEGFTLAGDLDLMVDWRRMQPAMRSFHGYPYTSVGITLTRI